MDDAQKKVDSELKKTEKELTEIYEEAIKDLQDKWDKYIEGYRDKADRLSKEMKDALDSGDDEAYAKAKEAYENFMMPKIRRNTYYSDMVNQMTDQLAHVNQTSLDIVNGKLPDVYTISYNNFDEESKNVSGYSFSLVDRNTIVDLVQDKKLKLPAKKLDVPKDKKWNEKKINSQMLQGVLQGESMDKIAKRLRNVTDMNKVSAIRNARTMTTSAECKGRQDSYEQAVKDGVKMKRIWLSAHDARTRDWHYELNGQAVEVDEPFTNSIGKIMYPGDPSAHPANVYNCRCSIRAKILGFVPSEEYVAQQEQQTENVKGSGVQGERSDKYLGT